MNFLNWFCAIFIASFSSNILASTSNSMPVDANTQSVEDNLSAVSLDSDQARSTILDIQPHDIVLGHPNAEVVVIEYYSPTCIACADYHLRFFKAVHEQFIATQKITYVIREFISNKQDFAAAIFTRCCRNKSPQDLALYNQAMQYLFEHQDAWVYKRNLPQALLDLGQIMGILPEEYDTCYNDPVLRQQLMEQRLRTTELSNVIGVPLFLINGKPIQSSYDTLAREIAEALKNCNP